MKKLIILNYNTGTVHIIDAPAGDHEEYYEAVDAWCERNRKSIHNCDWMAFDGNISHEADKPLQPLITESTHGEMTLGDAVGEEQDNRANSLPERLYTFHQSSSGQAITGTGEEFTNMAIGWLHYVQQHTDFGICQLCQRKVK